MGSALTAARLYPNGVLDIVTAWPSSIRRTPPSACRSNARSSIQWLIAVQGAMSTAERDDLVCYLAYSLAGWGQRPVLLLLSPSSLLFRPQMGSDLACQLIKPSGLHLTLGPTTGREACIASLSALATSTMPPMQCNPLKWLPCAVCWQPGGPQRGLDWLSTHVPAHLTGQGYVHTLAGFSGCLASPPSCCSSL